MQAIQNFANSVKNIAMSPRGKVVIAKAAVVGTFAILGLSAYFIAKKVEAKKSRQKWGVSV